MEGHVELTDFKWGDFVRGRVTNVKVYPVRSQSGTMKLKKEDNSKHFKLTYDTKELIVTDANTIAENVAVAKALKRVGLKVETFKFKDKIYDLNGEEKN